jgi:hypothetical protein
MSAYGYEDALAMVEAELGQTFTWSGNTYTCTIGDRTEGRALEEGGFALAADLVLVARLAQFNGTPPTTQDKITIGSRSMRVSDVSHSPCGTFLVINLVDDSRGV